MEHYLDNAATTQVCPEAAEAALRAMRDTYGNPSSTHRKGREARKLLDACREQVAAALGARNADEVVFTSCGSESDTWALCAGAESMNGETLGTLCRHHDDSRRRVVFPYVTQELHARNARQNHITYNDVRTAAGIDIKPLGSVHRRLARMAEEAEKVPEVMTRHKVVLYDQNFQNLTLLLY